MAANLIQDGFACQLVPTGIRRTGDNYEILVTALFTPVPLKDAPASGDILERWPSLMAHHLNSKLGVRIRPALSQEAGEVIEQSVTSTLETRLDLLVKSKLYKSKDEVLATLDTLWAEWFSRNGSFAELRGLLNDASAKTAETAFHDVKQRGTAKPVPDVIAVPRADLGRKLAAARAQDLLTNAANALLASASTLRVDRKGWIARIMGRPYAEVPWAKTRTRTPNATTSLEPFHLTGGVDSVEEGKRPQWASLETELRAERAALDNALNGRLDPHREAARSYAEQFRKCINETNPKELYELLKGVGASTPFCPTEFTPDARDETLETALNEDLALHVASTQTDHGTRNPPMEWINQRWHMLQGMHALSRLVLLAAEICIAIPRAKLIAAAGLPLTAAPKAIGYFELALESDLTAGDQFFTLSKFTVPADDGDISNCWATSAEEWATVMSKADMTRCGDVPIEVSDGVVDLEAWVTTSTGKEHRRFDVLTLDPVLAAEAEVKRQRATASANEVREESGGAVPEGDIVETAETSNLRTVALQLFDRWRQASLVREFVSSCDALAGRRRIEARDLRIGFKVDAGTTQSKDGARVWTSLTDRKIKYTSLAGDAEIDRLLDYLVGNDASGGGGRAQIDAAMVNAGARLLDNGDDLPGDKSARKTAFAEQTLVSWDGDPLGQRPGEFGTDAGMLAIPVHQEVELEQEGDNRPLKLRFGGSYAFGLREVLRGGCAIPLDQAKGAYSEFAYPASKTELLRYLRHERIGGPLVAVDHQLVVAEFASERHGIDGKLMVVRSLPPGEVAPGETWRFEPASTSRVLFAPAVDMKFASRHGALGDKQRQAGGLLDIDYDAEWGGFPVFDPKGPAVLEAVRGYYFTHEQQTTDKKGNIVNSDSPPTGISAVRPRVKHGERQVTKRYYPDPAARYMVIALRRPNDPNGYLLNEAIRVPLYPQASGNGGLDVPGYPDARPVVLTITRNSAKDAEALTCYNDVRKRAGISTDDGWRKVKVGKGVATNVVIELKPGEDFEIETWCLPDEVQLRAWFDLPEGVAYLRQQLGDDNPQVAPLLPHVVETPDDDLTVRRGDATIRFQLVRNTAKALYTAMLSRPLPEIASVRRLRAVHATGLPATAPAFVTTTVPALSLLRLTPPALASALKATSADWEHSDYVDGGRELLIGGQVEVDASSTEAIELRVQAVGPRGEAFDDINRGRSAEARARGIWPRTRRDETGRVVPVPMGQSAKAEDYMRELFGFDVAPDGRALPQPTDGLLARWEVPFGSDTVDLHEQTKSLLAKNRASPIEQLFPDTRAHRLSVTLAATSRSARHIPDRSIYPDADERKLDERRNLLLGASTEIILRATERPVALNAGSMLPAFTWVHPTDEPTALERRTKIRVRLRRPWWTSGEDERLGIVVWPPNLTVAKDTMPSQGDQRDADQESNLEDDIWDKDDLEAGKMLPPEPLPHEPKLADQIDLMKVYPEDEAPWRKGFFTDADLGPGGPYVTRWGADPIQAADHLSWFMSKEHFADLRDAAPTIDTIATAGLETAGLWPVEQRDRPRFVQNVLMPIPDNDGEDGKQDKDKPAAATAQPQFMLVSLMTYTPRFDPDFEHWYADVEIDVGESRDPFVRLGLVRFQPHADRHLQVSAPEVKWVQVVSYKRHVKAKRVTRPLSGQPGVFDWANITVDGSDPSDPTIPIEDEYGMDQSDRQSRQNRFVVTLIARQTLPTGQITEHIAYLGEADAQLVQRPAGNVVETVLGQTGTSQRLEIELPLPTPYDGEIVSYSVLVEEVQVAPRSSFSNEPVMSLGDIKEGEELIYSGARFAVRIDVPPALERPAAGPASATAS
jgi:hypothetical protein